ncbi:hypothetical protein JXI42_01785 [bacterium]|nr:hypothetical protein [bacterium]
MKTKMIFLLIVLGYLAAAFLSAEGFEMRAISGNYSAGEQYILIAWHDTTGISSFNLFRRAEGQPYSSTPLNSTPISKWTDCSRIESLIPPDSEEYIRLMDALFSSSLSATLGVFDYDMLSTYGLLPIVPEDYLELSPAPSFTPTPSTPMAPSPMMPSFPMSPTPMTPATPSMELLNLELPIWAGLLFEPCSLTNVTEDSEADSIVDLLKRAYWKIAVVMGNAYVDSTASNGVTYYYKLEPSSSPGTILDTVEITAGATVSLPAPTGLTVQAGDRQVLVSWNKPDTSLWYIGYHIYRKISGSPVRINDALQVSDHHKTDTLYATEDSAVYAINETLCWVPGSSPPTLAPCEDCKSSFLDYQRWDTYGNPVDHVVVTDTVEGPSVVYNYRYRITMIDYLGREGSFTSYSSQVSPYDSTPPTVPTSVTVDSYKDSLVINWWGVDYDILSHYDTIDGYQVYRYDSLGDTTSGTAIGSMVPDDTSLVVEKYSLADDDTSALRENYGEKVYYYRVRASDIYGNWSARSGAGHGHLEDYIPPDPPKDLTAKGFTDYIGLEWVPNVSDTDVAGYYVYRGVCGEDSVCEDWHTTNFGNQSITQCVAWKHTILEVYLIGIIEDPNASTFSDTSMPKDAAVCYRYTVKAYDLSQNISDTSNTVCVKLLERTPPPQPVIASLKARDRKVRVEWVSPPVQDLFGFLVERRLESSSDWDTISPDLVFPEADHICDSIPAVNTWAEDCTYLFIDSTAIPETTYYYRVRGADYLGNIGDPSTAIKTYTFTFMQPETPEITSVAAVTESCALKIKWTPSYQSGHKGFVVFRRSDYSPYRQVSSYIQENTYVDYQVAKGETYYYKVQYFAEEGKNFSEPSDEESGSVSP